MADGATAAPDGAVDASRAFEALEAASKENSQRQAEIERRLVSLAQAFMGSNASLKAGDRIRTAAAESTSAVQNSSGASRCVLIAGPGASRLYATLAPAAGEAVIDHRGQSLRLRVANGGDPASWGECNALVYALGTSSAADVSADVQQLLASPALASVALAVVPEGPGEESIEETLGLQSRTQPWTVVRDGVEALKEFLVTASSRRAAVAEAEQSSLKTAQIRCLALLDALDAAVAEAGDTAAPAGGAAASRGLPEVDSGGAAATAAPPKKSPADVGYSEPPKPKTPALPVKKDYQLLGTRPKFGEGREMLPGGGYYEGQFRHFKRDGEGFLIMDADEVEKYEGQFKDEFMHGYGRRVWKDGAVYLGEWARGRKDGAGKFEEKGRVYDGQWKDGKRHGKGVQVFDKTTRYEGLWANGMQHGSGKYFNEEDSSIFEGKWLNGAHHGVGILHRKDGSKERLEYHHGMLQSREVRAPPGKA